MNKDFKMYIGKRVWCKTEELAKEFLQLAHENGWEWRDVGSLLESTSWEEYEKNTCYFVGENKKITYGSIRHYYINEFIEYDPLCAGNDISPEETKEQTFRLSLDECNRIMDLLNDEIEELKDYITDDYEYPEEDLAELVNRLNYLVRLYEKLKEQKEKENE